MSEKDKIGASRAENTTAAAAAASSAQRDATRAALDIATGEVAYEVAFAEFKLGDPDRAAESATNLAATFEARRAVAEATDDVVREATNDVVESATTEELATACGELARVRQAFEAMGAALAEAREQACETCAPTPTCSTCNDTHVMPLGDREVMCTRCPRPCERCGNGPFCATTPCGCSCHAPAGGDDGQR